MSQFKFFACPTTDGNVQVEAKWPTSYEELVAEFMYNEKSGLSRHDVLTNFVSLWIHDMMAKTQDGIKFSSWIGEPNNEFVLEV